MFYKYLITTASILAQQLFNSAQNLLNATHASKLEAYKLLTVAATLGHKEARSMLAWAQLLGIPISTTTRSLIQNIPVTYQTFKELAEVGLPSAHMVCE